MGPSASLAFLPSESRPKVGRRHLKRRSHSGITVEVHGSMASKTRLLHRLSFPVLAMATHGNSGILRTPCRGSKEGPETSEFAACASADHDFTWLVKGYGFASVSIPLTNQPHIYENLLKVTIRPPLFNSLGSRKLTHSLTIP